MIHVPAVHAYAPEVVAALAERIPATLPQAAHWNPEWGAAAAAAALRMLALEAEDPEDFGPGHRCVAASPLGPGEADPVKAGANWVLGIAPQRLAEAVAGLERAFLAGEEEDIVAAIAALAMSAADLADPFATTPVEVDEVVTARARFADLPEPGELSSIVPAEGEIQDDPFRAGQALAIESARARGAVEAAVSAGDQATLARLRRDLLGAALAATRSLAASAWRAARSPSVDGAAVPLGRVLVSPNPARTMATLSFRLPLGGPARVELFDALGRRLSERDLGMRPAGPQGASFGASLLRSLPPGLYMLRVSARSYAATGRMVRIRE